MAEYSIYCPFDLEQHKKTYIDYLEVIIAEDGNIMYAVPSHQEKLISLACSRLKVSRDELAARCPRSMYFDYMGYLCGEARAMAVWNDRCVAVNPTSKQIAALRRLKLAGVYHGVVPHQGKESNHD